MPKKRAPTGDYAVSTAMSDLLAKAIRALLEKHSMTQVELARRAKIPQSNLSELLSNSGEQRTRRFQGRHVVSLAAAFGISSDELMVLAGVNPEAIQAGEMAVRVLDVVTKNLADSESDEEFVDKLVGFDVPKAMQKFVTEHAHEITLTEFRLLLSHRVVDPKAATSGEYWSKVLQFIRSVRSA